MRKFEGSPLPECLVANPQTTFTSSWQPVIGNMVMIGTVLPRCISSTVRVFTRSVGFVEAGIQTC